MTAHSNELAAAQAEIERLEQREADLLEANSSYWARNVDLGNENRMLVSTVALLSRFIAANVRERP